MPFDPLPNQLYRIVAKHSGKAIGARDGLPHQGTNLTQVEPKDHRSQHFLLNRRGGDYFNFLLADNGQSMDVFGDNRGDDATVGRWHRTDEQWNQQYCLLPAGDGTYFISARHSEKFLCVKGGSQSNGADFVQHVWDGGDHYRFSFVPVAPIQGRALREPALRGADPLREAALGLVGILPKVGGGVKFLLGHLWSSGPSLIAQMKDYVTGIAQALIDEQFFQTMNTDLAAMTDTVRNFERAMSGTEKGRWLATIINDLGKLKHKAFQDQGGRVPERILPYIAAVGTLHLTALRERLLRLGEYYEPNAYDANGLQQDLQADIKLFSDKAAAARENALTWRKALISSWTENRQRPNHGSYECFFAKDDFDGWRHSATRTDQNIDQRRNERNAALEEHTRVAIEDFTADLDAIFKAVSAWKYLDPAVTERPKITPVVVTSPTYGFQNGTKFDSGQVASLDSPIREVTLWFNDAGNQVHGITIRTNDKTIKAGAEKGKYHSMTWRPGESVIGAYGNSDGALQSAFLVSNMGLIIGSGQRAHGTAWRSEPPLPGGSLNSIFGWANGDRIEGIGFRWSYPKHE